MWTDIFNFCSSYFTIAIAYRTKLGNTKKVECKMAYEQFFSLVDFFFSANPLVCFYLLHKSYFNIWSIECQCFPLLRFLSLYYTIYYSDLLPSTNSADFFQNYIITYFVCLLLNDNLENCWVGISKYFVAFLCV